MTTAAPTEGNKLDCPACGRGEIAWAKMEGTNFVEFDYGTCDSCGTPAGRCPICEEVTDIDGSTKCAGCLGQYEPTQHPGEADYSKVTWWMPEEEQ